MPLLRIELIVSQMQGLREAQRVKVAVYPGGHMFYSSRASAAAFKADLKVIYQR